MEATLNHDNVSHFPDGHNIIWGSLTLVQSGANGPSNGYRRGRPLSAAFPLLESESKRVGLYRGVADDYCTLPAGLGPGRDDPAGSDRLPVALQLCLAWGFERVMNIPLVSIAQVRILAEGAFQPLPGCGTLPERLTPKTHLHREQIQKGLPPARRLGLRDLRFCT